MREPWFCFGFVVLIWFYAKVFGNLAGFSVFFGFLLQNLFGLMVFIILALWLKIRPSGFTTIRPSGFGLMDQFGFLDKVCQTSL